MAEHRILTARSTPSLPGALGHRVMTALPGAGHRCQGLSGTRLPVAQLGGFLVLLEKGAKS